MKLCKYYVAIKDLKDGETILFTCDCRCHKGSELQVVKVNGEWRQIVVKSKENKQ